MEPTTRGSSLRKRNDRTQQNELLRLLVYKTDYCTSGNIRFLRVLFNVDEKLRSAALYEAVQTRGPLIC